MWLSRILILLRLISVITAANNITTNSICGQLASELPSRVFLPDAPTYDTTISSYPFIQLRLHPSCVLRPKSAQDVAIALQILQGDNSTRFAVKGGGHNANASFNNVDNGVTIDMQSMKAVEVARGDQVVRVEAGALSQDAYDAAEKRNLTVLAGRIGVVGTAGYLTGGGVSFLSPQYGWACDSIVNFEVALASGEIVNANATSRSDLFTALKGGQNNFGIVTRFDLKAYPATNIWGGRIVYAPSAAGDLLTAFTNFMTAATLDPYIAGWVTIRYNHSTALYNPVAIMWYTKPTLKPGGLKEITEVKPQVMNGMIEAPISEHARNASRQVVATPRRTIWATTSFRVNQFIVHQVHELWRNLVPAICETHAYANPSAELTLQALPAPPRNGSAPNSLGFSSDETPEKNMVFLEVVFTFDGAEATKGLEKGLKDLIEVIEELTKAEGRYHPYKYLNFAAWFQDPLGSYGKEQKDELRRVARRYDPASVFQRQVSGFKLF
ncbi:FAD binding domain-containing protein [Phaeosphaeria sp. MPI-PUGE-AT-0046c]|nr:FAD binding domain-containing protein [Phaeosphaeria sp. MPI-PUGE-AT-0046c]